MSDAAFDQVIGMTLAFEGGYVDDPADPGGETNFGISRRSYPDLDIRNLTRAEATAIYRRDWWDKYDLAELPDPIGAKIFDAAVNIGYAAATRVLQRAINRCGDAIAVDGALGRETRAAAKALDPAMLLPEICRCAAEHYQAIAEARPASRKYLQGWLRRAAAMPIPVSAAGFERTDAS